MQTVKRADVAIIGAGVVGCSVAYYLCRRGITNIALIEKEEFPGSGSTSKAAGGIRAQFTTEANILTSLLSMDLLDQMDEEMLAQTGYVKAGYLFVTADGRNHAQLRDSVRLQQGLGVPVEEISPEEIRIHFPYIRSDDLVGGSFGSRDGFIDSGGLTTAYYSRARSMGMRTLTKTTAKGLKRSNGVVVGVETTNGAIEAEVVVDAAGPYAAEVAAWADVELPVQPIRSNIGVTGPTPGLAKQIPMTIDVETSLVIRREGEGCSMAWTNPAEPQGFNTRFDPEFVERIAPKIERRFPPLAEAGIAFSKCWAGLYPETPDHHGIVGESGVGGFLLATGLGGHGIMHSPAVGYVVSELIAKGKVESLDITPFALKRFESGKLNVEHAVF